MSKYLASRPGLMPATAVCMLLLITVPRIFGEVVVNEILASNRGAVADEEEDTPDVVELYNAGASHVDLAGFGLTDDEGEPDQWVLPAVILPPGGLLLIFCSGKDRIVSADAEGGQPVFHASFKLSSAGESVLLTGAGGDVLDSVDFPEQAPDRSYGRHGFRFTESTQVFFSDTAAPKVEFVSANELIVTVPFDAAIGGTPEITLVDPEGGSWSARGLLDLEIGAGVSFRRGDADGNGRLSVTDAVTALRHLVGLETEPLCDDAVDVDDSGSVTVTDAVFLLDYLLRSGARAPSPPISSCGSDPTADGLGCEGRNLCE